MRFAFYNSSSNLVMKHILIVASMLGRDGTSRFITYLANGMSQKEGFHVSLLFFRKVDPFFLNKFDAKVSVETLNISGKIWTAFFILVGKIIKKKPDICIIGFHQLVLMGFLTPLMNIFGVRLLIRDTIIPSLFHRDTNCIKRILIKKAYTCFDNIIVQSKDMQNDLINNWWVKKEKTILVNNPVDIKKINSEILSCPDILKNKDKYTFVAAGRLSYQKGYDIIIKRMAEIKNELSFKLIILGSGEKENEIKALISENGLESSIILAGYSKDVASYIHYADALLLCSRYEGFPNIVLEAQALGKPVLSNKCPGGINEIIVNGKNGLYCDFENLESFKKGLKEFQGYDFYEEEIRKMTSDRYGVEVIMNQYTNIFKIL